MVAVIKTVALVGGTSGLGYKIAKVLLSDDFKVVLLTREESQASKKAVLDELAALGAKSIAVDYSSVDSLKAALLGVDAIVCVIGGAGTTSQLTLIEAAKAAGVKRFLPSEWGFQLSKLGRGYMPLTDAKFDVREALETSGLEWTLVESGMFTESQFDAWIGFDWDNGKVLIRGTGDEPFTLMSTTDIAKFMPGILRDPATVNTNVRLSSETVTWNQAVKIFEAATGKTPEVTFISIQDTKAAIAAATDFMQALGHWIALPIAEGHGTVDEPVWNTGKGDVITLEQYVSDPMLNADRHWYNTS